MTMILPDGTVLSRTPEVILSPAQLSASCPDSHCYCDRARCCASGRHCYSHANGCHLNCP